MQPHDLYQHLTNIPFLDLGPVLDFDRIKNEILLALSDTTLHSMNSRHPSDNSYLNLAVEGIFDYKGMPEISAHCDSCLGDYQVRGKMTVPFTTGERTRITKFGKKLPTLTQTISALLSSPGRVRLSVLPAHTDVGWHSHFYGDHRLTEITLHIPVVTNPQVVAQVGRCDFDALSSPDAQAERWFDVPEYIWSEFFSEGRIWLLNSRHAHRFSNQSDQDRVHIWITTHLYDNKGNVINENLKNLIEQAVYNYQGPIIQSYQST